MMAGSEMNNIIAVIRSILISAPGRCLPVRQIQSDYREVEGSMIPFKKFNFRTIEEFLEASNEFLIRQTSEGIKVFPKANKESAHVSKLIDEQTRKKKKPSRFSTPRAVQPRSKQFTVQNSAYSTNIYPKLPNRSTKKAVEVWSHSGRMNQQQQSVGSNVHQEQRPYQQQHQQHQANVLNSQNENNVVNFKRAITKSNTEFNKINTNIETKSNGASDKMPSAPLSIVTNGYGGRIQNRLQININGMQKKNESPAPAKLTTPLNPSNVPPTESKPKLSNRLLLTQYLNTAPTVPTSSISNRLKIAQQSTGDTIDFAQSRSIVQQSVKPVNMELKPVVKHIDMEMLSNLDPIDALYEYCVMKGYSLPNYKLLRVVNTNKFQCHVFVNKATYSTYPNEFSTDIEAKLNAATYALEQIKQNEIKEKYPICMDSSKEVAIKILNCIHKNGVFKKEIPQIFKDLYSEMLQEDWFRVVEENPQMFTCLDAVNDHIIVYPNSAEPTSTPSQSLSEQFSIKITINQVVPDQLVLPNERHWNLYVTNPVSTDEIWARIIGSEYSDAMDSLITDIEMELLTNKTVATHLDIGRYYLVEQSECWSRIRIDKIDENEKRALCFFIDAGDLEWFKTNQIYECHEKYLKFPAQAICFSLYGLEDFAENPNAKQHLDELLATKVVIGDIITKIEDYLAQVNSKDLEAKIQTILYDTSNIDDIELNSLILERISEKSLPPQLQESNNISITHVADNGDIFCHLKTASNSTHYIKKLIHQLTENDIDYTQYRLSSVKDIKRGKFYLIYDRFDKKWYRAEILSVADNNHTTCKCIDTGEQKNVEFDNIYQLDRLSAALGKFPAQSILVRLYDVTKYNANIIARLRGLLTPDSEVLAKVMKFATVPLVNIYKRMEPDNHLCAINETIRMEPDLEALQNVVSHAISPVLKNQQKENNLVEIKPCKIPSKSEFFNLYVTMASSPDNFKVRAHKNEQQFRDLMDNLQVYCQQVNEKISEDSLKVGQSYAGLNIDGIWYRVIIQKILPASMILAYNCDYGDIIFMSIDNLKPLAKEFCEMPQAAITAKLHGVRPHNKDWSTEDCTRFQELVVGKQFVSDIKAIKKDPEIVLELVLIDVSTPIDVLISDVLVNESRAVNE